MVNLIVRKMWPSPARGGNGRFVRIPAKILTHGNVLNS